MLPKANPYTSLTLKKSIDPYPYFIACLFSSPSTLPSASTFTYFINNALLGTIKLFRERYPLSTRSNPNLEPISPASTPFKGSKF